MFSNAGAYLQSYLQEGSDMAKLPQRKLSNPGISPPSRVAYARDEGVLQTLLRRGPLLDFV